MNKLLGLGFALILLHSCQTLEYASSINLSQNYELSAGRPEAGIRAFAPNDSIAQIYVQLPLPPLSEEWQLRYSLISGYYSAQLLDTGSLNLMSENELNMVWQASIRHEPGKDFLLKIDLQAGARARKFSYIIDLFTSKARGPHAILPLLPDGSIWFQDFLPQGVPMKLRCADVMEDTPITVHFYRETHSLAPPPFSSVAHPVFKTQADSIFTIEVRNHISDTFSLSGQGMYHILADPIRRTGISLIRPVTGYPFLSSAEQMIHCARYIMTNKEFRNCIEASDKKGAIDAFWIEISGNPVRARSLMADYYRRVEEANKLFVCDTEGWKTDRGMIYIIFGPPDIANRSDKVETWTYGELGYSRSLVFQFIKNDNPFTNMDYRLERLPNYKDPWYTAVNQWRR